MNEFDAKVPIYYVVRRGLSDHETEALLYAMQITPVLAVVITDPHDAELGLKLSSEILKTRTEMEAHELARHVSMDQGRPLLIIGEAYFLDEYYEDGTHNGVSINATEAN